jgi:N-acetylmuramoyl-L-alanine amidase
MRTRSSFEDIADDTPILDGTTEVLPVAPSAPRRQRDVTFRPRVGGASRSSKRSNDVAVWGPRALAIVGAIVVLGSLVWAFSGGHGASTSASAGPTQAKAAAGVAMNAAHAKQAKPAKRKKSAAKAQARTSSTSTTAKSAAKAKTAAAAKSARTVAVASTGLSGKVVVIDAGHQGQGDSSLEPVGPGSSQKKAKVADGASGSSAPHAESAVNLQVALKLRSALQARGVKVVMVRTSQNVNISNSQRAAIANKAHAALFIRLHCDGISNKSTHGFSTLIPASNHWTSPIVSASAKAGRLVHGATLKATGAADRGVVDRGDLSGFNWSKVPTILVEMGFMSNTAEDRALTSSAYQNKLATGLANGTVAYLKSR